MAAPLPNGGPAFPIVEHDDRYGTRVCPGLTIADWFAGQALSGYLADGAITSEKAASCAEQCYDFAEAMVAEKLKREQKPAE